MESIFYAMIGWCGTKWPGWRPGPKPDPDPEPWWRGALFGLAGGIVGQLAANFALGEAGSVLTSSLGAFAGGVIVKDIAGGLMGR